MNRSVIRFVLAHIMIIEGVLMLLPVITGLIYGEEVYKKYMAVAASAVCLGLILKWKKPAKMTFYLKEGCVATAFSWIMLSIIGCIPFLLTKEIPSFADALFETVSGFTTTGASILYDIESLSHASLIWRSFTHWIGGMGVLVFLLTIVSMTGGSSMNLMRAESPGPSVGKLVPRIRESARFLYGIYLMLSLIEYLCLLAGGMTVFDALNTMFATAGTGGFGIKNDSIASYSATLQWIITVFMILFGVNFNAYFFIFRKKFKELLKLEEVVWYFAIIILSVGIIFVCIGHSDGTFSDAFRDSAFQIASIITTTGFSTVDFNLWNSTAKTLLVFIMFCGACAGSTGGGIKVSRFMILFKVLKKEMNLYVHPKSIKEIQMNGKPVEHDVVRTCSTFLITYMGVFVISLFLISFDNFDLTTNFTAIAASINNIGPGLEMVGPSGNFAQFSAFSKYVLMFDMLAGRLELFPMLILLNPAIWKDLQRRVRK